MAGPEREPLHVLPARLPLAQARRVLVLAPHPDDECIGCGGLIAALQAAKVPLKVVLVTDGSGAGGLPPGAGRVRQQEFTAALAKLGVKYHSMLGLPDGGLVEGPALFDAVADVARGFSPNWLVAPSGADAHRDHRCVAAAARRAARAVPTVETIVEYETWSPLLPTHVLDIGAFLAAKLDALREHHTALKHGSYLKATEGLAHYRGLLLGGNAADAAAEVYRLVDVQV